MKTSRRKRFLSALLALVMLLTLLPASAFADSTAAENHVITSLSELTDGARVVIFNPANMMTLSQKYNGNYNAGTKLGGSAAAPTGYTYFDVWTVGKNADATYTFSTADGKKLAMTTQYTSTPLDAEYPNWIVSETSGGFYIDNADRIAQDGKGRLEWYADLSRWTGYNVGSTGSLFVQQFYLVNEELTPDDDGGGTGTLPEDGVLQVGDKVVIYNAANMKALSSVYSGYYNTAVPVSMNGDALTGFYSTEVWIVGADSSGNYTFAPYDDPSARLSMGTSNSSMPLDGVNKGWQIENAKTEGCYYVKNVGRNVFVEYYLDKGTWSGYYNNSDEALFALKFYKVTGDVSVHQTGYVPQNGDEVLIYNASAGGVFGMPDELNVSLGCVPATVKNAVASEVGNGARLFKVTLNGSDYTFESGGLYLACDETESLFLTEDTSAAIYWTISAGTDGYVIYNRDVKYKTSKVCIEYYTGSFSGWTYKAADKEIFEMQFCRLGEGITVTKGVVNKPQVNFTSGDAYKGMDYTLDFSVESVFGIGGISVLMNGSPISFSRTDNFRAEIKAKDISGDKLVFSVSGTDTEGVVFDGSFTVNVLDEPVISSVSPAANSATYENKRPVISARLINAGDDAAVTMLLNGEEVKTVMTGGMVSYTPDKDMADDKVNVKLTVTRADGKSTEKSWSFVVGDVTMRLYFGQLHSHTGEYSDGSGTLSDALSYVEKLPASANVQFVAFTDHSNYFDSKNDVNPEQALYDMSLASAANQATWNRYKDTVAQFNADHSDIVAVAGYEMTWSGGPGHINTFNTPGIVSRNNSTLNNKTSDAGMKAYYALLSQAEGASSLSQFNHPGTTFGTFSDFAYWDATIDSRVFLVEVGNGEGQVGAGGYFPSYEYYIMALDKGWHVAPSNNQDNHKGKWGNANDARDVILTDDFTEAGIYQAIRDMRVYATEDKNLEIYYTVNGNQLGSAITEVPNDLEVNISVSDPDASDSISKVELVVNSGKVAYTWSDPAELADGQLSANIRPDYSYYFVRVTEGDGDLAVTAPVWVGESLKLGISGFESETMTPVTGEEITLKTTFFNSQSSNAVVEKIVYTVDGSVVLGEDDTGYTIASSATCDASFSFTPDVAKVMTVTATAIINQEGKEYQFSKDLTLDILNADDLVYIGVDGSHQNEYVEGNYKDNLGNFSNLAAEYSVRLNEFKTSAELIAACSNDKYKAIILTPPSRRNGTSLRTPYDCYTDAELQAIASYNKAGGTVIVSGWGDIYENYAAFSAADHMAAQQNKLLAALGSGLRIGDDCATDEVMGSAYDSQNGSRRLYFSAYNFDSFLMNGVEFDAEHPDNNLYTELYSQYGGATVYAVDKSGNPTAVLPSSITPVVFTHATTYSSDEDKDGLGGALVPKYKFTDGSDRLLAMATEQVGTNGLIIVSGAVFLSNFEVQAEVEDSGAEKNYSNYQICRNLLTYINPVVISNIAKVRAQTDVGFKYTIEGVVTANASGYDKDTAFFDCTYIQDKTAGINVFPVAGNYKVGDIVRITGTTAYYQGEPELQVTAIEKIGEQEDPVTPVDITAKQLNDRSVEGQLVTVKGTVESFELENGLVQTIMVKDAAGDLARVFIDGYITTAEDVKDIEVGCRITATGLASYDDTFNAPTGPFPRIRVRDRADVVCTSSVIPEPVNPFTDIGGVSQSFRNAILWAYNNNIAAGATATTYNPGGSCTRAQVVSFLWRAAGKPAPTSSYNPFKDVKMTAYYYNAILWAVENNITAGYDNPDGSKSFKPNDTVTRGQFITFLWRYEGRPAPTVTDNPFNDVKSGGFYNAILWGSENGIVAGYNNDDGTMSFRPNNPCTRAHVAVFLYRDLVTE